MSPLLASYVIIMACIAFGSAISLFTFDKKMVVRIAALWAVTISVSVFTNIWGLIFAVLVAVAAIRNQSESIKILYFIALLPALPLQKYKIPFPGINFLWDISFSRLLVLCLFLPILLTSINKIFGPGGRLRASDIFFLLYLALIMILTLRQGNVINAMRDMLNIVVQVGIPYFVISRFVTNPAQLNWILSAFLVSIVFISLFSILESRLSWRFFSEIVYKLSLSYDFWALIPSTRDGITRASGGTMFQPLAFAYIVAMAMIVSIYFWLKRNISLIALTVLLPVFLFGLFLTGSRGGVLILLLGAMALYYLSLKKMVRYFLGFIIIAAVPFFIGALFTMDFSTIDRQGTFDYRYQLVLNSFNVIAKNPLFGSISYLESAELERSRQGEGIIDVVNLYLWVTLNYGFVGLFLYLMIFFTIIKDVWFKKSVIGIDHKNLMLTLLMMTMVFIATCSGVSFIPWYLIIVLALARAYVDFPEEQVTQPKLYVGQIIAQNVRN